MPMLANILVDAERDLLHLTATDLEVGVRVAVPACVRECLIPLRMAGRREQRVSQCGLREPSVFIGTVGVYRNACATGLSRKSHNAASPSGSRSTFQRIGPVEYAPTA